jgi:hypothetical protein
MKKKRRHASNELQREYNFTSMAGGVRGKYVGRLAAGTNVVILDDEVAAAFPTDAAVNEALRAVLRAAAVVWQQKKPPKRPLQPTGSARG